MPAAAPPAWPARDRAPSIYLFGRGTLPGRAQACRGRASAGARPRADPPTGTRAAATAACDGAAVVAVFRPTAT
eukprot:3016909-Prymnesium_polylepis.1